MRLTLRVIGVTILDLDVTDDFPRAPSASTHLAPGRSNAATTRCSTTSTPTTMPADPTYGVCRWHGCTAQASVIVVTWDGWCVERCPGCAHRIVDPTSTRGGDAA